MPCLEHLESNSVVLPRPSGGRWREVAIHESAGAGLSMDLQDGDRVRHPKWDERPLLLIVKKAGSALTENELLDFFNGRLVKWSVPDAVVFVDSVPHGATGKVLKHQLREQFTDYFVPA